MSDKTWTDARIKSFIVAVLRAGSRKWPPKFQALADAYVGKRINKKTGREGKHYLCNKCKEIYPSSNVQVDHIIPIIDPKVGFTTWDDFIKNLFCSKENLQVLCKPCHDKKTKEERNESKNRSRNS